MANEGLAALCITFGNGSSLAYAYYQTLYASQAATMAEHELIAAIANFGYQKNYTDKLAHNGKASEILANL